jgi:hypothetical protein
MFTLCIYIIYPCIDSEGSELEESYGTINRNYSYDKNEKTNLRITTMKTDIKYV